MQFKQVIGQLNIKERLLYSVKENRISHTQLFLGKPGSGNLALALAYATYINCKNPTPDDSCGECSSCIKFSKLTHPDLHFTVPTVSPRKISAEVMEEWRKVLLENAYITEADWLQALSDGGNKQGNITADECRSIIQRLSLKAYEAKYKVLIIWLPEYLGKEGNILLKVLEEPPENTLILLVSNEIDRVLPTILSRTQMLKVPRIDDESVIHALINDYKCDEQRAVDICRIAEGDFSQVMRLLQVEESGYYDRFSKWMRVCYTGKVEDIQKWVDDLNVMGREYIKSFLTYSVQMFRAGFVHKYGDDSLLRINPNERGFLKNFVNFLSNQNLPEIVGRLDQTMSHISRNANTKIIFLNLSLYIGKQIRSAKAA